MRKKERWGMEMDKFFEVTVKAGHVGRNNYIEIPLFIIAESKKKAAEKARWMPRVKHHDKGAIIDVVEIKWQEYSVGRRKNSEDPYFNAKSIQDQRTLCGQFEIKQCETQNFNITQKVKCLTEKEFKVKNPRKFKRYYGTFKKNSIINEFYVA
jgi:hypothetical protein